ncbi:unnamed protein product [Ceutorhynchus assimilis]|uniref:Uncharacterized protein n=1 Tax=Ceutorhynchus assimilis TaxID=467358 RepID=A0A9N9MMA5_9CUCU|nr:unnamed protein product [Ceutorhynchus assimilis]
MLKQWAKTKINEVEWIELQLEDKFNNIKFETTEVADIEKSQEKSVKKDSITLNKNSLLNISPIQETNNNFNSEPSIIDSSPSDLENRPSKESSYENQDQNFQDNQKSGVDIEVQHLENYNEQNQVEVLQEDQGLDIRDEHIMVSADLSADPNHIANKENNKWSSLKYSRSKRLRRKRESLQKNQPLITNFSTLIQKISTIIEEEADHFKDFTEAAKKLEETRENNCDNENLEKIIFNDNEVTNEGNIDIGQNVLANDLVLVQDENLLDDNIDLRDYSDQKIYISEGSPYLRVTLPNDKMTDCDCLPLCTDLYYNVETSASFWEWRDAIKVINPAFENFFDRSGMSMSSLVIYFKNNQFVTSRRHELYGPTDFLGNFGGLLGLFTGFSILSLMEIIYFSTVRIICNFKLYGKWSGDEKME